MFSRVSHWRKMTWALWIWSVLCLIWLIAGIALVSSHPLCSGLPASTCGTATDFGAGVAGFLIFTIWLVVFLILTLIWFMTRPHNRQCPRCGEEVRKGLTTCAKCGYEFGVTPSVG